ncbi:MAG: hypothetical protein QGH15_06405 [Kiritimatiellia bacterium]|jgi:hypothetical protein|nr:hypothetical protein [Kiritimatiellia bacterium]
MRRISWTTKCEDGVKREIRANVTHGGVKWSFKRKDEDHWDYDSAATKEEWDELEDILERRTRRGKAGNMLEALRKLRRDFHV